MQGSRAPLVAQLHEILALWDYQMTAAGAARTLPHIILAGYPQPFFRVVAAICDAGNHEGYPAQVHTVAFEECLASSRSALSTTTIRFWPVPVLCSILARRAASCVLISEVPPLQASGAVTRYRSSRSPGDASQ
jgi:hypothetical protein